MCFSRESNPDTLALIANVLPIELSGRNPSQHNIHSVRQLFGDGIWSVIWTSATEKNVEVYFSRSVTNNRADPLPSGCLGEYCVNWDVVQIAQLEEDWQL